MRRRAVVAVLSTVVVTAVFAACTDLSGLSGDDTTDASSQSDTTMSAPDAGGVDAEIADVTVADVTTRDDATATVDASGCTTCDCDNDMSLVRDAGCALSNFDCDDLDPLVNPGASFVSAAWSSPHVPAGDWNCDGVATKQYAFGKVCPFANNCFGQAFEGNPACGATADFFDCKQGAGSLCQKVNLGPRTQACK